jgi:hypothetical protein
MEQQDVFSLFMHSMISMKIYLQSTLLKVRKSILSLVFFNGAKQFILELKSALSIKFIGQVWSLIFPFISQIDKIIGNSEAYVNSFSGENYTVKLDENYCSCFMWQDTLIPCSHAISVITTLKRNITDFLPTCYTSRNFLAFYSNHIPAISFNQLEKGNCLPPPLSRGRGRPKKKRIPSRWEESEKKKKKCGFCKEVGHNVKTCPNHS